MNVSARVKCPGCSLHTPVGFREPKWKRPAIFTFECSGCSSTVMAKVEAPVVRSAKTSEKGDHSKFGCKIGVKITKPSPALLAMLKQEAEEREEQSGSSLGSGDEPGGDGAIDHIDSPAFTPGEPDPGVLRAGDTHSNSHTQTFDVSKTGVSDPAAAESV